MIYRNQLSDNKTDSPHEGHQSNPAEAGLDRAIMTNISKCSPNPRLKEELNGLVKRSFLLKTMM